MKILNFLLQLQLTNRPLDDLSTVGPRRGRRRSGRRDARREFLSDERRALTDISRPWLILLPSPVLSHDVDASLQKIRSEVFNFQPRYLSSESADTDTEYRVAVTIEDG
jgi:hypothetical protein